MMRRDLQCEEPEEECSWARGEQVKRLQWGCGLAICEEEKAGKQEVGVRRDGVRAGREARSHGAVPEFVVSLSVLESH